MRKERVWELDALRGLCILCVIVIHFVFDLQYFLHLDLRLPAAYLFIQNNGAVLFILISGICATLGSRSFRRGLIVFGCGLLISAVTLGMVRFGMAGRDAIIYFGILHMLGASMMLYPLLRRLPTGLLTTLGAAMILLGYWLLRQHFATDVFFFLGIRSKQFFSGDYFPLLPFLGWFCEGVVLGRTLYREKKTLLPGKAGDLRIVRFFRFCGRHSLFIYLAHQPLCYGLLMLITQIF